MIKHNVRLQKPFRAGVTFFKELILPEHCPSVARQASTDLPSNSDSKNFAPELSYASQKCIEMKDLFDAGNWEKISRGT
ncbi:hypothetical protein HGO34_00970 [Agrobacterium vitis]|uniref:Uncharacterized protein n=1 Tax=Agrobacterium vitis TaxID=373 RepID=A0AAE5AUQ4_AGRVI|nr:hypothetical protein [Agrobacterium vitis]MCF1498597.1 hypothetical protein [Allorhizobium sp. Av2]MCM2438284.1 hypothetical protein [Agrobacterium vitis]MUZ56335.1 hypothetical protein [Agrobacterium vitis]MVA64528.1 hypothetical protein [Agrobacterium vitis]MVA85499.1 hypothetical protein [Agrobacterium vitis]